MRYCLITLVSIGMFAVAGCKAIKDTNAQADALATTVLNLTAENKAAEIYDQYGATELREQVDKDKWAAVIAIGSSMGKAKSWTRTSFDIKVENGVSLGKFEYDVKWEKGDGTFTLKTKKEGDQMKVLGVNFYSEKGPKKTEPPASETQPKKK